MKHNCKIKLFLLAILLFSGISLSARGITPVEGDYKGVISDINFTPLQLSIFSEEKMQLFDEKAHAFVVLGLISAQQKSSIIAFAPLCVVNNYFLQVATLGNLNGNNWGIAIAPIGNGHEKCYGLQVGFLNYISCKSGGIQAGFYNDRGMIQLGIRNQSGIVQIGFSNVGNHFMSEEAEKKEKTCVQFQLGLLNDADDDDSIQLGAINESGRVQFGLINTNEKDGFQFGLFNTSVGRWKNSFQIGILNYNKRSYIPWMPLINFDMGKKE